MASGAALLNGYVHGWAHTLARNLHQSELAQRQDVVTRAILLHVLAHALIEQLSVLGEVHVDKVNDDDASHVAQSQLACQLVGCTQVGLQCVGFLSVFFLDARSAVHIDHVHSLCMFYDEVGSSLVVDGASESRFDLFGNAEIVENRHVAIVELDDVGLFRGNECDIVVNLVVDVGIVDVNAVVGGVEQVAYECYAAALFLERE